MLRRIILNEWRSLFADKALLALLIIFVASIGYGIFNGNMWSKRQAENYRQLAGIHPQKLEDLKQQLVEKRPSPPGFGNQVPDNPYSMSILLADVALPPTSLAVLSVGQSDLYLNNTQAYLWSDLDSLFSKNEPQNPVNLLTGRFDLAFVIVFLFPLMILAFSYNLLSAEKENGTLALTLSQPVTPLKLAVGKIVAQSLIVFPITILSTVVGIALSGTDFSTNDGPFPRIAMWMLIVVSYGLFWFALAAIVNSLGLISTTNAVILAASWLLFLVVVPSLLNTLSTTAYPVPSRSELIIASRDADPDVDKDGQKVLAKFYEDHPELRPSANEAEITDFRRQLLLVFLNNLEASKPLAARYRDQLVAQQRLVRFLSFISPAVIAQEAFNDVAGTGFERHRKFRDQVESFIEDERNFFVPRVVKGDKLTSKDYDSIPRFRFREEETSQVFARFVLAFSILTALVLVGFVLSARRLVNYSPLG